MFFGVVAALAAAQPKDISGTWVAHTQRPGGGEAEISYLFKVENGKITGSQTLPFGDAPIVDGKFTSNDEFEFTAAVDMFGSVHNVTGKGKVAGDTLEITPALPSPPPPPPGTPPNARRRFSFGTVVARRGTPTPNYRAPAVDYKTLPKVELPALQDVPYNGLAKTPPLGWNSWNKFQTRFNDKTVRAIADAMIVSGMKDAGYQFINIDDGWQGKRDANGVLQPNPNFPDMKALAGYVHSKGLKLGIYSSPGPHTCAGYEGSYGHEDIDAKTWASWGIDYLKYDWCSASRVWKDQDMQAVYQRMGEALRKCGRPIVFSLCQYGRNHVEQWGPKVSGNLWRTTGDIRDQWQSMERIGFSQTDLAQYAAPGQWNDPDMLEIGNGGMTTEEYRTHFSLWAMIAAPLIAGNDLRNMSDDIKSILLNKDVIAVDQDKLGKGGQRIAQNGQKEIWAKPLDKGAYAIALFNRGPSAQEISVKWSDVKLSGSRNVRDLWKHQDLGKKADSFSASVPSHGVVMIRVW